MTCINLLPEQYLIARQRNAQQRKLRASIIVASVLLLTWSLALVLHLRHLDSQVSDAQRRLPPLQKELANLEQLHRQRDGLLDQSRMLDRLRDPIPTAAILALLTQLFPDEAVLQSLVIQVPSPSFPPMASPTSPQARLKTAVPTVVTPRVIAVQLEGLVLSDVVCAQLARELSQTGLFRNIRIENAQQTTIASQNLHQFRVSIEIQLDDVQQQTIPPSSRLATR